jgi:hypothetical protein
MPIHWTISHPDRLVVAVCEGVVCRSDVEAYLDDIVVAGTLPYRKIFETRDAIAKVDDNDMMALGARIQAYVNTAIEPMGPLAIVAATQEGYEYARLYRVLSEGRRPLKIFRNLQTARRWLDSLKPDA